MRLKRIISIKVIILILIISTNIALADTYYYDVFGHWAEETVYWATNYVKIFNGYEDGTFKPDNFISRAEYIKALYQTSKEQGILKVQNNTVNNKVNEEIEKENNEMSTDETTIKHINYKDLSEEFWAYKHIETIANYINESGRKIKFKDIFIGENFEPNKYITREEAALLTSFFASPSINENKMEFSDINNDYIYIDVITELATNGIITGYTDKTFKPKNNITRAESATILKRLYEDMEYIKGKYFNDIQFIDNDFIDTFPLFGQYDNDNITDNDRKYNLAITTLEYKSIGGYIFPGEEHMYDSNPANTLLELKDEDYPNIIGVNYYLARFGNLSQEEKEKLYHEILDDYLIREDLSDYESYLIFKEALKFELPWEKLIKALDKWHNSTENINIKINIEFMRYKVYINNGLFEELKELIENNNLDKIKEAWQDDIEIKKTIIMNNAYVLAQLGEYERAEAILRDEWEKIKNEPFYIANKDKYDREFIGALKQILIMKKNYRFSNVEITDVNN